MKLQNIILSGAFKYVPKLPSNMDERNTHIKPQTTPPGFIKSVLENFHNDKKTYQAVISFFDLMILDDNGGFDVLDEEKAGQLDLVAKQLYFNCFLVSWLGCTETVGRVNVTNSRRDSQFSNFSQSMNRYGFPEFDGEDVTQFSENFIKTLYRVTASEIISPYFPLYLHEKYNKGLFFVENTPFEYKSANGNTVTVDEPTPIKLEVSAMGAHRPNFVISNPQAYLTSFYHLKGQLEITRMAFKAIIQALTDRLEEHQPFVLQLGYVFEANVVSKHKTRLTVKVATTFKNCCDPFWDTFGFANADLFDIHQNSNQLAILEDDNSSNKNEE